MKIKAKLFIGFLPVVILMVVLGVYGIFANKHIVDSLMQHSEKEMPVNGAILSLRIAIEESMREVEEYDADWISKDQAEDELKEQKGLVKDGFSALAASGIFSLEDLRQQERLVAEFYALGDELIEIHDKSREEKKATMAEFDEKTEELDKGFDDLLRHNSEALSARMDDIQKSSHSFIAVNMLLVVLFVLITLMATFFVSASIVGPITNLKNAALDISNGDYESNVKVESNDEVGKLAVIFNVMTKNIKEAQLEIEEKTRELAQKNKELEDTLEDFYMMRTGMARDMEKGILEKENKKIRSRIAELKAE